MFVKRFALLALAVLLIVNLAACSKEKPKNTLEEIKSRGKIIVGTEAALPPYEFVEGGKIVGYGPDILKEIIKNMNVELEQQDVPFSGILAGLENKKFDLVATAISVNPERQEKFGLTVPIGDFLYSLVKRTGDDRLTKPDDINGKKIGTNTGSVVETELTKYNERLKAEGKEGFEIIRYQNMADVYMDLKNGRVDAVISGLLTLKNIDKKEPGAYERFDGGIEIHQYASWAVRKEDKELLEFLNAEILKMKKSGKLAELQEKWIGETFDLPDQLP